MGGDSDTRQAWGAGALCPSCKSHHSRTWGVAGVTDNAMHWRTAELSQERALRTGHVGSKAGGGGSTSGRECARALGWRHTEGESAEANVASAEGARGRGSGQQRCRPGQPLGGLALPLSQPGQSDLALFERGWVCTRAWEVRGHPKRWCSDPVCLGFFLRSHTVARGFPIRPGCLAA